MPQETSPMPSAPKPEVRKIFRRKSPEKTPAQAARRPDMARVDVENNRLVVAAKNSGDKKEIRANEHLAYQAIYDRTVASIDQDPEVLQALTTQNPQRLASARESAATRTWGKFAEQSPHTAEMFSNGDPRVKRALMRYERSQMAEAQRNVAERTRNLLSTDRGMIDAQNMGGEAGRKEAEDRKNMTEATYRAQAWNEYFYSNPDTARLLAESNVDPDFTNAYNQFLFRQEAYRDYYATQAMQAAQAGGPEAGLSAIAQGSKPPEANHPTQPLPRETRPAEPGHEPWWDEHDELPYSTHEPAPRPTPPTRRTQQQSTARNQRQVTSAERRTQSTEPTQPAAENPTPINPRENAEQAQVAQRLTSIEQTLQSIQTRLESSHPLSESTPRLDLTELSENIAALSAEQRTQEMARLYGEYQQEEDPEKQRSLLAELGMLALAVISNSAIDQAQAATEVPPGTTGH